MERFTELINYYKSLLSPVGCRILDFMAENYKQKQFNCTMPNKVFTDNKKKKENKGIGDLSMTMNSHAFTSQNNVICSTNEAFHHNSYNIDNSPSKHMPHTVCVYTKRPAIQSDLHGERQSTSLISNESAEFQIEWDNMFDTALLPIFEDIKRTNDARCNAPNTSEGIDTDTSIHETRFIQSNENDVSEIKTATKQCKKRESSQSIINKVVSKKNKNNISSESKIRIQNVPKCQKYTKTVQNWLENIESTVKEADTLDNVIRHKDASQTMKKVIQTQLINKNGIMKYTKNKAVSDKKEQNFSDSLKCNTNQLENTRVTDCILLVESQLPLDVTIIDESNIHEEIKNISGKYKEIVLLLIYGDGFNQSELRLKAPSSCASEGLFLQMASDSYSQYYLKGKKFALPDTIKEFLKLVITDAEVICYNAKDVLKYLACWLDLQYDLHNVKFLDLQVGVSLLHAEHPLDSFASTIAALGVQNVSASVDTRGVADMLRAAAAALRTALAAEGLEKLFYNIEIPILPIIAGMEMHGVEVDIEKLKYMESSLLLELNAAEAACHAAAGREFLVTSQPQVRALLYEELRLHTCLPAAKFFDTTDTSENALKKLSTVHPLPSLILEFRRLHKTHATFIGGMVQHVKEGIVSPKWSQNAARTGRIACREPNLQAVPKVQELRAILKARQSRVLLAADFQQMECRVFAALAADEKLMDLLNAPGDFFLLLAAQWLGRPACQVSAKERERTKRIVYASLYGAGVRSLADLLETTYDRTLQFLSSFKRSFPSLCRFGEDAVRRCVAADGKLSLPSGRRRCLTAIASRDATQRAHAERQAMNFLVQGTAADLCKVAMERTATALRTLRLDTPFLLQVHDELVWEVPLQHLHSVAGVIQPAMEGCGEALGLRLRLPVALSYGPNWGEMITLD